MGLGIGLGNARLRVMRRLAAVAVAGRAVVVAAPEVVVAVAAAERRLPLKSLMLRWMRIGAALPLVPLLAALGVRAGGAAGAVVGGVAGA